MALLYAVPCNFSTASAYLTKYSVCGRRCSRQYQRSQILLRRAFTEQRLIPENSAVTTLPPIPESAHHVILMRHGESEFNNANVFTEWCDVALTPRGVVEAAEAGQVFPSHNLNHSRRCHTSMLTRSIVTAQRSLEAAGASFTPLHYDWRLNERHYGALQGLGKDRTADRLGRALVMEWRRSTTRDLRS